jgi:phosphatidylglycerol:prolipoprotein diacylglycerol transferase
MLRYARKWPSGRISAFFLIFYGFFRCVGEIFRVPDDGLYKGITWGQWYSFPMIVIGALLLIRSLKAQSSQSHLL